MSPKLSRLSRAAKAWKRKKATALRMAMLKAKNEEDDARELGQYRELEESWSEEQALLDQAEALLAEAKVVLAEAKKRKQERLGHGDASTTEKAKMPLMQPNPHVVRVPTLGKIDFSIKLTKADKMKELLDLRWPVKRGVTNGFVHWKVEKRHLKGWVMMSKEDVGHRQRALALMMATFEDWQERWEEL